MYIPRRPGHWVALVACSFGAGWTLGWMRQAWGWFLAHWQVSLCAGLLLVLWLTKIYHAHTLASRQILEAVKHAPSALTSVQILTLVDDHITPELVQARVHDLCARGDLEAVGMDAPGEPIRYRVGRTDGG